MKIKKKIFDDVIVFEQKIHSDNRGYFFEMSKSSILKEAGIFETFHQTNVSFSSVQNTLRGLHTQVGNYAQAKLLSVVTGSILDVIVNIDRTSKHFGHWGAVQLEANGPKSIYIPPHYLHGFATLESCSTVIYQCSAEYSPEHEKTVHFADPQLQIEWGLDQDEFVLSDKDKKGISFEQFVADILS